MTATELQSEALSRATSGQSMANFATIVNGFAAKGIPVEDIRPRENILTYHAFRAIGRQVRRGEHGVKVITYVTATKKDAPESQDGGVATLTKKSTFRRPWVATVFHISQTDPI